MTIEELLNEANKYIVYAFVNENDAKRQMFAAIALAAATTAQAMMAAEARQEWLEQLVAEYEADCDDYRVSSH